MVKDRLNVFVKDAAVTESADIGDTIDFGVAKNFNGNGGLILRGVVTTTLVGNDASGATTADTLKLELKTSSDASNFTTAITVAVPALTKGTVFEVALPEIKDVRALKLFANCTKASDGSAATFKAGKIHAYLTRR